MLHFYPSAEHKSTPGPFNTLEASFQCIFMQTPERWSGASQSNLIASNTINRRQYIKTVIASAVRHIILLETLGTWHGLFQDIQESNGTVCSCRRVAMATRDVDVYAQALLPTPRETSSSSSSSRNTRSKCQTILAELFTGSLPETMLSSWRVAATSTTRTTLTTCTASAVHEYRHLISRKHFCTGCWLSHCYQATNVLLIEHWNVHTGFVSYGYGQLLHGLSRSLCARRIRAADCHVHVSRCLMHLFKSIYFTFWGIDVRIMAPNAAQSINEDIYLPVIFWPFYCYS